MKSYKVLQRTISFLISDIIKFNNLINFSVSYINVNSKGDSVRVYIICEQVEKTNYIIDLLNNEYLNDIKKGLAKTHRFSYIPWIGFFADEEYNKNNSINYVLY